tara:strand:- start:420 stop:614 length:195 start_codon:yes stop_codon:yes gene_type:complete
MNSFLTITTLFKYTWATTYKGKQMNIFIKLMEKIIDFMDSDIFAGIIIILILLAIIVQSIKILS